MLDLEEVLQTESSEFRDDAAEAHRWIYWLVAT